jgi:23S rRNA (guanosine2251-2'-O)-methyltransferase
MTTDFIIFECANKKCLFRYPVRANSKYQNICPRCKAPVRIALEYSEHTLNRVVTTKYNKTSFSLLLDNLRSVYNVGSIMRSADGFNISQVYLCGMTATPENPKFSKTGLGAEDAVSWSYSPNSLITAQNLKENGNYLYALETGPKSHPIYEIEKLKDNLKIVLIVGNELAGIDPQVRDLCNKQIYIPMMGFKSSFNVTVALGIAAFFLRYKNDFYSNPIYLNQSI